MFRVWSDVVVGALFAALHGARCVQANLSKHAPRSGAHRLPVMATLLAAALAWTAPMKVLANESICGPIDITSIGPFDFRKHARDYKVVVDHHFTPDIEALRLRSNGTPPGGDLSYTLRSIPNHHRALLAVTRYGERWGDKGLQFSVECYFDRAVRFAPDDTVVRGLYANFLMSRKRKPEAEQQLDAAVSLAGDNGFSHYNIGLRYLQLGQAPKALAQAHRARALGFMRSDLEDALKRAGHWREPEPTTSTN